jgi:hypothetical protein
LFSNITIAGTSDASVSGAIRGTMSLTNTSASNIVHGGLFSARSLSSGAFNFLIGVGAGIDMQSANTGTNAVGVNITLSKQVGGTTPNVYGIRLADLINSAGTIANTFGIYVGDITTGTQTNVPYSLYLSDANAKTYIAGPTSIGTTTIASDRLDIQGTTASDGGQIGAELATTGAFDASWSGVSFASGYTHTAGADTSITTTLTAVIGSPYQLIYTITERTTGGVTISFGGLTTGSITTTGTTSWLQTKTISGTTLTVTPTTDFNGKVVISVKRITAGTVATLVLKNSSGTIISEQRATKTECVYIGVGAGKFHTTGTGNVGIGSGALGSVTSGSSNVAIGPSALASFLTGNSNFALGSQALFNLTSGINNTAIGTQALLANISSSSNVAIGTLALANAQSGNNVGVGRNALNGQTSGNANTGIGDGAGQTNTTGARNIFIGLNSGRYFSVSNFDNTVVNNSIFIGYQAKALLSGSTNETVLGYYAIGLGTNTSVIGNTTTTRAKIWGSLENQSAGSTNATTSLLIQNSGSRALLTVKDGGAIEVGANVTVTGNTTATIQATDSATNVGIALAPKGSGAFTLSIPDGTSVGGNDRGTNAVDLQQSRGFATNVAAGHYSVIGGGSWNSIYESYSTSTIAGGGLNTITKGNSTISGGYSNTITTNGSVISGGESNTATVNDFTSIVGGKECNTYLYGQTARASGKLVTVGDAQTSEFIVRRIVTGSGATELFLDGISLRAKLDSGTTTNRLWNVVANTSAIVLSGDTEPLAKGTSWINMKLAGIKKVNSTTSLVGSPSNFDTLSDVGMSGTQISLTADDTNDALIVQFTAPSTATSATVFYVVTTIKITEVGFN